MSIFTESDLILDLSKTHFPKRTKDSSYPTPGWKDVDYIFKYRSRTVYLELKDPDNPNATPKKIAEFMEELIKGQIDKDLYYKFRDSYLNEQLSTVGDRNRIDYYIIIAMESLTEVELQTRSINMQRNLPVGIPNNSKWKHPIADSCFVFNLRTWNEHFPEILIKRK